MAIKVGAGKDSGIVLHSGTVERLIRIENGTALRLYLLLCQGSPADSQSICRRLGVSDAELEDAEACLISHGLASREAEQRQKPHTCRELDRAPEYSRDEIAALKTGDSAFSQIVTETERLIKPLLNESDLRSLMTVYSYYGMPADCFITLIHFVAARTAFQTDGTRRPSMQTIMKEAGYWLENGINSIEKAEIYVDTEMELTKLVGEFEAVLGLPACSNEDRWVLRDWARMGFDADGVKLAADICVKRKGEVILVYIGRILRSWKNKGLTDSAQIHKLELAAEHERELNRTAAARRSGKRTVQTERELSSAERAALDSLFQNN